MTDRIQVFASILIVLVLAVVAVFRFGAVESTGDEGSRAAASTNAAQEAGSGAPPEVRSGASEGVRNETDTDRASGKSGDLTLGEVDRTYLSRWSEGGDLKSLADRLLKKAKRGEPAAQYYLSEILRECVGGFTSVYPNQKFFSDRLERQKKRYSGPLIDLMKMEKSACEGFWQVDPGTRYGTQAEWLEKAVNTGFSPAVAKAVAKESRNASVTEDPAMMNRLRESIHSGHPVALMELRSVMADSVAPSILNRGATGGVIKTAMMRLACENGFPCGPDSRFVTAYCSYGQVLCSDEESQADFFRTFSGNGRYEDVVTVSEKIEEAIEEDRLEELFENG